MSVKLVFIHIIFSYAVTNINSIKICCNPQSQLYKIRGSNNLTSFECNSMGAPNKTDHSFELLGTTEKPQGYGFENLNEINRALKMPQCPHTVYLNVSLFTEISVSLLPKSCLLIVNSNLIGVKCKANVEEVPRSVGFVNKCCPHGHVFISELNKCFLREPDFDVYSYIFDKSTIFVDNSFTCPQSKVFVEYVLPAHKIIFKNGKMLIKDYNKSFQRREFCIEAVNMLIDDESNENKMNTQRFIIRTCQQIKICDSVPCVRKCCADGEIYSKGNLTTSCKRDENDFKFQSLNGMNTSGVFTKPSEFGVLTGLECPKFRLDPESFPDESHVISSTSGSLLITSTKKLYSNGQYCIEKTKNSSFVNQKLYTFLCFDSKVVNNDRIRFKMYPVGLLISCCFYAITLMVYSSIEKLRNLPGKILICLVSSLLFAYLGIALGQLLPTSNNDICFMSGFCVYFFLMAAFSWMNITCFDIWKTFGSTESTNLQRREQRSRFIRYSLYGWGMPTVLTTITASLSKSDLLKENMRPIFGHGRCWFTYDAIGFASLVFFSGPLGILFIVNLVFFLLTLKYCNKVKREIFRMQSSNAEKHTLKSRFFMDKTRFIMNTKLCFVMGITWLLEIASILFYDHKKNFFWSISDSFNVLLGVFVFIIFVFKRRVWREIMVKLGFWSSNDLRRNANATCVTQSTCVPQNISMKKLGDGNGDTPLVRRT